MATLKNYGVFHQRSHSPRPHVEFYQDRKDALVEYEEIRQTYRREHVWVKDMENDRIIADSRAR